MADEETICHEMQPHSLQDCSGTTPPDIQSQLPLTPPATAERLRQTADTSVVNAAIRFLELYKDRGKTVNIAQWIQFPIHRKVYGSLRENIERSFKRFDYDPNHGLLVLRMPSPVHDFFANILAHDLQDRLNDIAKEDDEIGAFASRIKSGGSSTILLSEGDSKSFESIRREPDAQFRHPLAYYPGVVIEVSYSQEGKNLRKLAQDYILYSNGDIKAVIGIDINYNGKESTISLWRPKYTWSEDGSIEDLGFREVLSDEPFRSFDGSVSNAEKCLNLNLGDFATDALSAAHQSVPVSMPFCRLYEILQEAEEMEPAKEPNVAGNIMKSKRVTRKRRLSSSSAEQLFSEDEAKHLALEEAAAERADRLDRDFEGPVTKRRG